MRVSPVEAQRLVERGIAKGWVVLTGRVYDGYRQDNSKNRCPVPDRPTRNRFVIPQDGHRATYSGSSGLR